MGDRIWCVTLPLRSILPNLLLLPAFTAPHPKLPLSPPNHLPTNCTCLHFSWAGGIFTCVWHAHIPLVISACDFGAHNDSVAFALPLWVLMAADQKIHYPRPLAGLDHKLDVDIPTSWNTKFSIVWLRKVFL